MRQDYIYGGRVGYEVGGEAERDIAERDERESRENDVDVRTNETSEKQVENRRTLRIGNTWSIGLRGIK